MGIDWKEWTKNVITVVIVIACIAGFIWLFHSSNVKSCRELGEITNYPTQYISGNCWIELCPGANVAKYDLPYYLDICD